MSKELLNTIDLYIGYLETFVNHSKWYEAVLNNFSASLQDSALQRKHFESETEYMQWCHQKTKEGYFDTDFGLTGIALIACQTHIERIRQIWIKLCKVWYTDRNVKLPNEAEHPRKRGRRIASNPEYFQIELICDLANYFKHRMEWPLDLDQVQDRRQKSTLDKIRHLIDDPKWGEDVRDSLAVFGIDNGSELHKLCPILDEWGRSILGDAYAIRKEASVRIANT